MSPGTRSVHERRRHGTVLVQVLALLVVLLGFAALSIDVGNLYVAKAELQNAADAAALAGASTFAEDDYRKYSLANISDVLLAEVQADVQARCLAYATRNEVVAKSVTLEAQDVIVGHFDFDNPSAPLDFTGRPNAVQVTPRFAGDSPNGPIVNFFASIFGFDTTDVSATATAAFDDRFAQYSQPTNGPLIPFTIHEDLYNDWLATGPDEYTYDEDLDVVQEFPDGLPEVSLYPHKFEDPPAGAGNFGLLAVGAADLATQVATGIPPEDLEAEVGTSDLDFVDDAGNPVTYAITGGTGLKSSLQPILEARLGDVVGFFVHSTVVDSGSNTTYTITKIAFARLVLTGDPDGTGYQVVVQPLVFSDPSVGLDPNAPSSAGMVGRVALVK